MRHNIQQFSKVIDALAPKPEGTGLGIRCECVHVAGGWTMDKFIAAMIHRYISTFSCSDDDLLQSSYDFRVKHLFNMYMFPSIVTVLAL